MVGAWQGNAINSGWQGQINWAPDMSNGYSNWATNNVLSGRESVNGVSIGTFSPYSVNFGNNMSTIWQNINVKNALNSTQTGLQVNGFSYSMNWKNGNNWDNAMTDQLYTFVNVIDANNRTIDSKNYNLSYHTGERWWFSSWTDTFKTPYAADQLKTIQFGFTGKDNNGNWWGYYGPELANINFRLNYSIDPCVANPLAHSNCSGYSAALAKLSSPVKSATTTAGVPAITSSTGTSTFTGVRDSTNTNYTATSVGGGTLSTTGTFRINDGLPQATRDSIQASSSTTNTITQTTNTTVTGSSTNITGTSSTSAQTDTTNTSGTTTNTTQATTTQTTQTTDLVQTASQAPIASTQVSNQSATRAVVPVVAVAAQSIRGAAQSPSIQTPGFNMYGGTAGSPQPAIQSSTQSSAGLQPLAGAQVITGVQSPSMPQQPQSQSTYSVVEQQPSNTANQSVVVPFRIELVKQGGSGDGIAVFVPPTSFSMPTESSQSNPMTASYGFSNNPVSISARSEFTEQMSTQQVQQEQPQQQQIAMYQPVKAQSMTESRQAEVQQQPTSTAVSPVGSKTNPVSEAIGPKKEVETAIEVKVEVATTVKTNVAPNELSMGIDTSTIQPGAPTLDKYINASLVDAPFYKVDTIYKNQFVVDNARAQRLLGRGSELKWQQIVDSQYKIGE
jgi:hypothetical protein